ncbi:hypothetical protein [Acidipila sp. EB88]|nr:hypothetical protein [Acidipila sp. EB88]
MLGLLSEAVALDWYSVATLYGGDAGRHHEAARRRATVQPYMGEVPQ